MSNKKRLVILNILSIIPGIVLVPLAPFTFILIQGEGLIPGTFHENTLKALMVVYPLILAICLFLSIRLYKLGKAHHALAISLLPILNAAMIVSVFIFGGIQLR